MGGEGIGWAVKQLLDGQHVRRSGWNGEGMWLALQVPDDNSKMTLAVRLYVHGAARSWLCSQTDLLATDWELAPYVRGDPL